MNDTNSADDDRVLFWLRIGWLSFAALTLLFAVTWRYDIGPGIETRTVGLIGSALLFAMFLGAWYLRASGYGAEEAEGYESTEAERILYEALIEFSPEAAQRADELRRVNGAIRQAADDLLDAYATGERDPGDGVYGGLDDDVPPSTIADELDESTA